MSTDGRRLLVIVLKGHRRLESVIEGFLELALPGATVLDARGMGEIVSADIPVFSGFRSLFGGVTEASGPPHSGNRRTTMPARPRLTPA